MAKMKTLLEIAQNEAFGNILLLIAAIIGVAGSYYIYYIKMEHQRKTLRIALLSEILSMEEMVRELAFQSDLNEMETVQPEIFLTNNIYDGNADKIGLLTEDEVKAIVEFYSNASKVQAAGNRQDGTIFIEAAERNLHSKLVRAIQELSSQMDSKPSELSELEDPIESYQSKEAL